jgi:lambda repressor-like predicted transcriptional regulator
MTERNGIHYGRLIKKMLAQKDISIRELSKKTGKSTQQIYNIFRTQYPRIDVVIDISMCVGFKFFIQTLISEVTELRESLSEEGTDISDALEQHERQIRKHRQEDRDYYTEKIDYFVEKIETIEQSLSLAQQVIKAKDELIEKMKKDG